MEVILFFFDCFVWECVGLGVGVVLCLGFMRGVVIVIGLL